MVVLTHASRSDDALTCLLREGGVSVRSIPTIQIILCRLSLDLSRFDWIAFTSRNGVRSVLESYPQLPSHLRFAAVGASTARPLRERGYEVELIPPRATGDALVEAFCGMPIGGRSVLVPTGDRADRVRWQKLVNAGATVHIETAYRTECVRDYSPEERDAFRRAETLVFASPSAFHCLLETFGAAILKGAEIAVIGPTTQRAIENAGFQVHIIPTEPSAVALAQAILRRERSRNARSCISSDT